MARYEEHTNTLPSMAECCLNIPLYQSFALDGTNHSDFTNIVNRCERRKCSWQKNLALESMQNV